MVHFQNMIVFSYRGFSNKLQERKTIKQPPSGKMGHIQIENYGHELCFYPGEVSKILSEERACMCACVE